MKRTNLNQGFKKEERLHSKKRIGLLFSEGESFFVYPFKVVYTTLPESSDYPVQLLISVSKQKFKHAVKRNRVKRLVRESYRKHKSILFEQENHEKKTLLVGLIYVANTIMDYHQIEKKIILILQRLKNRDEKGDR
jgi:ribonuclease P protein component